MLVAWMDAGAVYMHGTVWMSADYGNVAHYSYDADWTIRYIRSDPMMWYVKMRHGRGSGGGGTYSRSDTKGMLLQAMDQSGRSHEPLHVTDEDMVTRDGRHRQGSSSSGGGYPSVHPSVVTHWLTKRQQQHSSSDPPSPPVYSSRPSISATTTALHVYESVQEGRGGGASYPYHHSDDYPHVPAVYESVQGGRGGGASLSYPYHPYYHTPKCAGKVTSRAKS